MLSKVHLGFGGGGGSGGVGVGVGHDDHGFILSRFFIVDGEVRQDAALDLGQPGPHDPLQVSGGPDVPPLDAGALPQGSDEVRGVDRPDVP